MLYLLAYLLGAVPVGYLVARFHGVDILKSGSGNIGATNVGRVMGRGPAILVFVLDVVKGLVPPLVARFVWPETSWNLSLEDHVVLAGLCAIVGHTASPFLRFKGGKGIATGLGVLVAATPGVAAFAFGAFAIVFAVSQIVSASSIAAVVGMVTGALVLHQSPLCVGVYSALAAYIVYKHKANVGRMMRREEPKFQFKK